MKSRTCVHCGKNFDAAYGQQRLCSTECKTARFQSQCVASKRRQGVQPFKPASLHKCEQCGKQFRRRRARKAAPRFCSVPCFEEWNKAAYREPKQLALLVCARTPIMMCSVCARPYSSASDNRRWCSPKCEVAYHMRKAARRRQYARENKWRFPNKHRSRARKYGVPYKPINRIVVFERDEWTCYLCGCATPRELMGTIEAHAPTIEHVVPMSRGGGHVDGNVRCACRTCNLSKGAKLLAPEGYIESSEPLRGTDVPTRINSHATLTGSAKR